MMRSMDSTDLNPGIKPLLEAAPAFSQLSPDNLDYLLTHARLFRSEIGQELLLPDRIPEFFFLIVEGRGRLLYRPHNSSNPSTLAYAQPGDLIGWASLARRSPCEWVSTSEPLKLVGFPSECFYELEAKSPQFRHWVDTNNSPSEIISVLTPSLKRRPFSNPDDREVMRLLLPSMSLLPLRDSREITPESSSIYLWNAVPPDHKLTPGTPVDRDTLKSISPGFPLRVFKIDSQVWQNLFELPSTADSSLTHPVEVSHSVQSDRYSDLILAPEPQGTRVVQSSHLNSPTSTSKKSSSITWKNKSYPVITGFGDSQEVLACLEMLSRYFNIPFRRDVVERAAKQTFSTSSPTLQSIGNISTILGLVGTISILPRHHLNRMALPAIVLVDNQPSVIYDISNDTFRLVLPQFGPASLTVDELLSTDGSLEVLALVPGREAQQRKLNLAWFFPQIKKYRKSLIEVFCASLILQLLNLAQPLVMQQIFDKVIGQQNLDTLYTLGIILLGVSLAQGLLGAVRTYLFADTTNRIDITLGAEVIQHLLRLPLSYFDKRPVGELQTRIAELGNIRNFLTGSVLTLVLDSLFSVIYIAVMCIYSGVLTAVTLGVIPLFLGLTVVASPLIRAQLRKAAERNALTQSLLVESLNGVQTIKAQNAESNIRWQWQRRYSSYMSETFRTLVIGVSAGTVGSFLNQLTGLLTLWVGAYLVIQGDLTIGQLIAFRIISGYVVGPLLNLATSWQSFQGVALSMERLSDVVDAQDEAGEGEIDQLPLPTVSGAVEFEDVDFSFTDNSPLVVKSVSFAIPAGSFVGIVGRSGSGKSTIMKLLPRLYSPSAGRILIDGYDISKLQLSSVRRQIGIVPQDSLLFEGTIRDNIALTTPDASSDDIVAAARVACAHDFIMDLPEGYASRVGERGSGLSGGQRQRIAIARAVLQRPSLLILDEATSALDYLTERQVCLNLKNEFKGSTVFFITHRLSTIKSADTIILMESGNLVESGTHSQLLNLSGRYYALFNQQESDLD